MFLFVGRFLFPGCGVICLGWVLVRLFLLEPGLFLGRSGDWFVVRRGGVVLDRVSVGGVEEIVLGGRGVVVSSDAIRLAVERGVDVVVLGRNGLPVGVLVHPVLTGFARVRREQLRAYDDERGVVLAKGFVSGRIHGMRYVVYRVLRRLDEGLAGEVLEKLNGVLGEVEGVGGGRVDEVRSVLLGLEARAADYYWSAWRRVIRGFPGRVHRGARDPYNMALNYGYSLLYSEVLRGLLRAGLDPLAGFLHVDRWGRPSLVFDLVEEYRHPIVDYALFKEYLDRAPRVSDGGLVLEERRRIVFLVNQRLEKKTRRRGRETSLRQTILEQARRIASYLVGEAGEYKPFKLRY